jgi:thiamine biosynthesis lipoprotein
MDVLINDFEVMGTVFRFTFSAQDQEQVNQLLPLAHQMLIEADQTFSTYKSDSEISRIRRGELAVDAASFDVKQIYQVCDYWNLVTQGGFNAKDRAGLWDPSGVVKGWAAQSACNFLIANGIRDFSLNAGGDVLIGPAASGALERVGIARPISIAETGLHAGWILDLSGTDFRAVATSGIAERGQHIWGESSDLVQVTVVGKDLIDADVWATALFASGVELLTEFSKTDLEALLLFADGSEQRTAGFSNLETQLNTIKED